MSESSVTQNTRSDIYEPINAWYKELRPAQKSWVDDNWKSLLDGMLEYLQNSVDETVTEESEAEQSNTTVEKQNEDKSKPKIVFSSMGRGYWPSEDILSVVHCVDDLLEYKAIQAGQEGWTECYREYCKGKSESLPKIPSEGFRIYAPMHSGFTTISNDEGHATRMTSYYQTMSGGDGTYSESGYFVRVFYHHDADWNKSHAIKTEVYEAKRKPLGQFECKYIRNAYPILSYINGSSKPSMIQIAIEALDK